MASEGLSSLAGRRSHSKCSRVPPVTESIGDQGHSETVGTVTAVGRRAGVLFSVPVPVPQETGMVPQGPSPPWAMLPL